MPRRAFDWKKLAASVIVCFSFGSIHAYGVLLVPVSEWLRVGRGGASLGYSLAILALTAGVYVNGRLAGRVPVRIALLLSGALAALGLLLCASAASEPGLLIGFGLAFGLANGFAYAVSLSLAADASPGREAAGLGIATAAYGAGAVVLAQVFALVLPFLGIAEVFLGLAVVLLAACLAGALLSGTGREASPDINTARPAAEWRSLLPLWVTFLLGAFSGLLILAHAPAIAGAASGSAGQAGVASGLVSLGSVCGGYLGGVLSGALSIRLSLALPLLVQAGALSALTMTTAPTAILALLGLLGLCYGVLIAAVPAAVQRMWSREGFAGAYGKVFTAWGLGGLAGPLAAGFLFDATGQYGRSLVLAAVLSFLSFGFAFRVEKRC